MAEDNPLEAFRLALAGATRAIARRSDIHRAWALEAAGGALARAVPLPAVVHACYRGSRAQSALMATAPANPREPRKRARRHRRVP